MPDEKKETENETKDTGASDKSTKSETTIPKTEVKEKKNRLLEWHWQET